MSMYNLNETVKSEGTSAKVFPLGISENAEMTTVGVDTASNGNSFLKFEFKGEDGSSISHFEWPIDSNAEGWEKRLESQMKRVKHIMTKFLPEDKVLITANDFEGFAKQVITLLGNTYVGTKLRMKTVYSYNNYVSIPKYVPFMELMTTESTRLKVTNFDKMEKDEADNPSALNTTTSGNGVATEPAESDELPF